MLGSGCFGIEGSLEQGRPGRGRRSGAGQTGCELACQSFPSSVLLPALPGLSSSWSHLPPHRAGIVTAFLHAGPQKKAAAAPESTVLCRRPSPPRAPAAPREGRSTLLLSWVSALSQGDPGAESPLDHPQRLGLPPGGCQRLRSLPLSEGGFPSQQFLSVLLRAAAVHCSVLYLTNRPYM